MVWVSENERNRSGGLDRSVYGPDADRDDHAGSCKIGKMEMKEMQSAGSSAASFGLKEKFFDRIVMMMGRSWALSEKTADVGLLQIMMRRGLLLCFL